MANNITIDNKQYNFDNLPQAAKDQIQSLKFVDSEIARLNAQIAVFQTARSAYLKGLADSIASVQPPVLAGGGDTLKLN